MRLNIFEKRPDVNHEGTPSVALTAEQTLRRSVLSCLLWENEFYEDGQAIADRIMALAVDVAPEMVAGDPAGGRIVRIGGSVFPQW